MNILVSIDKNYALPLLVMLKSLFDNNRDESIAVYLLHDDLDGNMLSKIIKFVHKENQSIITTKVDKEIFKEFPMPKEYITIASYFRCLAPDFLPKNLDRILYLDVDIIVNKSLKDLYYSEFEHNYLIAAADSYHVVQSDDFKKALNIPADKKYFNAGMMIYNLKKFNREFNLDAIHEWVEANGSKIIFHDQDVLNGMFYDQVKLVDEGEYNCFVNRNCILNRNIRDIPIVHYVGKTKPWMLGYNPQGGNHYWKYAMRTPMRRHFIVKIMNNIIYLLTLFYLHLKRTNPRLAKALKAINERRKELGAMLNADFK